MSQAFQAALGMWLGMTFLMMMPVVAPWIRALAHLNRAQDGGGGAPVPMFAAGYAVAWAAFSVSAATAQTGLASIGASVPLLRSAPAAAGVSLLLVGSYQFTSLKDACLSHCRSPMGFFLTGWRPGPTGGLVMGLRHGFLCLGCCWALMALALVIGLADFRWMAMLMAVMVLETTAVGGGRLAHPIGVALALAGLGILLVGR